MTTQLPKTAFLFLLITAVFYSDFVYGQQSTLDDKSLIPLSPNAAELYKYSSIPVNMMTGTPSISLPLYEINTGKIRLPISLSYHASGIKVDQRASWVGLGWSLNAGGTISRAVRGMADETVNMGWFNDPTPLSSLNTSLDYLTLQGWCEGTTHDTHPDFFNYSLSSGKSGRFIYSRQQSAFVPLPYEPVLIQHVNTDPVLGNNLNNYSITDDDGTKYLFEAAEGYFASEFGNNHYTQSWYLTRIISADTQDTVYLNYNKGTQGVAYVENQTVESFSSTYTLVPSAGNYQAGTPTGTTSGGAVVSGNGYVHSLKNVLLGVQVLTEIDFRQGKVVFYAGTARQDDPGNALDSMVVYSKTMSGYQRVKSYRFNYDYFGDVFARGSAPTSSDYRLRLDSLMEQDLYRAQPSTYRFGYNPNLIAPLYSYGSDYWGFYNGHYENAALLPNVSPDLPGTYALAPLGNANRNPDDNAIMGGILQQITYPTKGYTVFQFEPNKYKTSAQPTLAEQLVGPTLYGQGLLARDTTQVNFQFPSDAFSNVGTLTMYFSPHSPNNNAQQVIIRDLTNNTSSSIYYHTGDNTVGLTTTATYTFNPTHQYGLFLAEQDPNTCYVSASITYQVLDTSHLILSGGGIRIHSVTTYDYDNTVKDREVYTYGPNENGVGNLLFSDTLMYQDARTQTADVQSGSGACTLTATTEKTFTASGSYSAVSFQGATVLYNSVTKYQMDSASNIPNGKTVYTYNIPNDYVAVHNNTAPGGFDRIDNSLFNTQLADQKDYAYDPASGGYTLKQEDVYTYDFYDPGLELAADCWVNTIYPGGSCDVLGSISDFGFNFYDVQLGSYRLTQLTQNEYDDDGNQLQTQKQYTYNNPVHLYPNFILTVDSKGNILQNQVSYPGDQPASDVNATVLDEMVARNMYKYPYLKSDFNNGSQLRYVRKIFGNQWNSNTAMILPQSDTLATVKGGVSAVSRFNQYTAYDSYANPLQTMDEKGIVKTYLWDYNSTYLVAQVQNAGRSDVAYTSFETTDSGNWNISGGSVNTTAGFTGAYSYNLSAGNSIQRSGLNSSRQYIVSYWSTNGTLTIPGTTPITGATHGVWTYHEHHLPTGSSTVTITGSGTNIDELRLFPTDAQMTTYTFSPEIGRTSTCDQNNMVTYYEYDGLGRLKDVKDLDGNVIKTFEYHYKGQ